MASFPETASDWLERAEDYDDQIAAVDARLADVCADLPNLRKTLLALKAALTVNRDQALSFTIKASEGWS